MRHRPRRWPPGLLAGIAAALLAGPVAPASGADERQVIELAPADRAHCLARMRMYLEVNNAILRASLAGDMAAVRRAALSAVPPPHRDPDLRGEAPARATGGGRGQGPGAGRARGQGEGAGRTPGEGPAAGAGQGRRGSGDGPPRQGRMQARMPQAYQAMIKSQHEAYQEIARDAEAVGEPAHTQEQLTRLQATCVACHRTYRFSR